MAKRTELWTKREWKMMREKLALLDVVDLKTIALKTGIKFTDGIDSIKDRPGQSVKFQLLLVLDESDPREIIREYERIIESRKNV